MECPVGCPPQVYELMIHCWQWDPNDRPKFSEARETLENMLSMTAPNLILPSATEEQVMIHKVKKLIIESTDWEIPSESVLQIIQTSDDERIPWFRERYVQL